MGISAHQLQLGDVGRDPSRPIAHHLDGMDTERHKVKALTKGLPLM
jgi:hypothetical protein